LGKLEDDKTRQKLSAGVKEFTLKKISKDKSRKLKGLGENVIPHENRSYYFVSHPTARLFKGAKGNPMVNDLNRLNFFG
jgi:hypothetical protein